MNWCGNRIDDTKEFVSDALTTGKEFVKGQCERGSEFWNNPSLISGLDWFSGGYVSACNQRYQEADDLYGYANWALSGIPDMVKGAFAPEKPGSFDHFMDSLGVATLFTSVCSSCTRGKVSISKNNTDNVSTTKIYRSVSEGEWADIQSKNYSFSLPAGGMESKQFGFNLAETQKFGNLMGQDIIISAEIPTSIINQFYTGGVDPMIFKSGTLTVYGEELELLNELAQGTIQRVQ